MKKLIISLVLLTMTGCSSIHYTVTKIDGTKEEFHARAFLANKSLQKLNVGKKTEKTSLGFSLGSSTDEVSVDGIQASGGAIGAMIGTALKTAK